MSTSGNWVHLPVLSAELPVGWNVAEAAAFVAPSGRTIWATVGRADESEATESLVERSLDELCKEFGEPTELASSTLRWRGSSVAHANTLRFDDPAHIRVIAGVVENGLAMRFTGSWATDVDDGIGDLETVLDGVRLLTRPAVELKPGDGSPDRTPNRERPPLEPGVWIDMRTAWSSEQRREPEPFAETSVWSLDELATIATMLGAPWFPTVPGEVLMGLTDTELRAVLAAMMRSLTARGVVENTPIGSAVLDHVTESMMEVALFPDLAISIQSRDEDGSSAATYFGVRPDDAVRVEAVSSGSRACGHVDPGRIVEAMMSLIGAHEHQTEVGPETLTLGSDELAARWTAMAAAWQVSTTWRDRHVVSGRVLYTARDTNGRFWITEPDDHDTWTLRSVSPTEIRDEVLDCLPGAT